jgi:CrcB protein
VRDVRRLAAVLAGGCLGTLARAGVAEGLPHAPGQWPWATLVVNVAGAALLGWVVTRRRGRALLGAGFCGALTTFSGLQLDLLDLLDAGRTGIAALYAAVTLAAGLAAVRLGQARA